MTEEEKQRIDESVARLVASWPPWKRNILNHSLQATNSQPRPPIDSGNPNSNSDENRH
jgi:hypothetical protein